MMHKSEENPAPTPIGYIADCVVSRNSRTLSYLKICGVKLVKNMRVFRPSILKI